jgi:pimeloyl-ACP methyl ester carboxylesterase
MNIVERGHGDPLILIPGIQGRWEYQRPAMDALAEFFRVITFALSDEPSARAPFDSARGLDNYVAQVSGALDRLGLDRAVVCGVSFGGLIALRFAARYPGRTTSLVLVSTPGPRWQLRRRHEMYSRRPWLFGPFFLAESPIRVGREVAIAIPRTADRLRFAVDQMRTLARTPLSLSRMAARARMIATTERLIECAAITAPTLIVHGNPRLDHVVDVNGTTEYSQLIRGACTLMLDGTGHLGSITRPRAFAASVRDFLMASDREPSHSAA